MHDVFKDYIIFMASKVSCINMKTGFFPPFDYHDEDIAKKILTIVRKQLLQSKEKRKFQTSDNISVMDHCDILWKEKVIKIRVN